MTRAVQIRPEALAKLEQAIAALHLIGLDPAQFVALLEASEISDVESEDAQDEINSLTVEAALEAYEELDHSPDSGAIAQYLHITEI